MIIDNRKINVVLGENLLQKEETETNIIKVCLHRLMDTNEKTAAIVEAIRTHPLYPVVKLLQLKCDKAIDSIDEEPLDSTPKIFSIEDVNQVLYSLN